MILGRYNTLDDMKNYKYIIISPCISIEYSASLKELILKFGWLDTPPPQLLSDTTAEYFMSFRGNK